MPSTLVGRRRSRRRPSRRARTRSRRGRSARRTTRTPTRAARCTSALARVAGDDRRGRRDRRARSLSTAGKVATTFFFSTSGGETESILDWTGHRARRTSSPSPDPYDSISPYHNWGPVPVTAQTIGKALKVPGPITRRYRRRSNAAGRVGKLTLVDAGSRRTTRRRRRRSRTALGLRSTWFTVGVMSLQAPVPQRRVAVRLAAHAHRHRARRRRRLARAARRSAATWQPVGPVRPPAALELDAAADDHDRLPARDADGRRGVRAHCASRRSSS